MLYIFMYNYVHVFHAPGSAIVCRHVPQLQVFVYGHYCSLVRCVVASATR